MTISDELQGLIQRLRDAKIEYALCGGLDMDDIRKLKGKDAAKD